MSSVPEQGNYAKMYLHTASTCLQQVHLDYLLGACLIQVGLYITFKMTKYDRCYHIYLAVRFPPPNNPKNLDLFYKTDLDLWGNFGGKDPQYSRITK